MAVSDNRIQQTYRLRVLLFLACVVSALAVLFVLWQAAGTLRQLDIVENGRDRWQRPSDVIRALDLRPGDTVVDLGAGAGYFALKLSSAVGSNGEVQAVDIRSLPLIFLRVRALLGRRHNLHIIHGSADDPGLGDGAVDAVLIANTYHEFAHPRIILARVRRALRPGGRLVVVDRGARSGNPEAQRHEASRAAAESEIHEAGFDIAGRDDRFIILPDDDPWWIVTARKHGAGFASTP